MSTLALRGAELANGPFGFRNLFKTVEGDKFDPITNPDGFVNIGTAENFIMLPEVAAFTSSREFNFTARNFSYGEGPWGTKRLREAMARHMNLNFKPAVEINEENILLANGVTSACELLGFTIAEPGDGILMSMPIYQAFSSDFGTKAKVRVVGTPFGDVDQFSPQAAACYEEALKRAERENTKIRALLLCNPHNPLGQCYPQETIIELMKLCNKYKIHLLSDEIYAMSVYDVPGLEAVPFQSVLSFDSSEHIDKDYLHVLYGMSKDFAAGGLRIGCLYTRNTELWNAVSAMNQFSWYGIGSEKVAIEILENESWLQIFWATSRKRLAERNKLTRSLLDSKGIPYLRGANVGFFIWTDLSQFLEGTGKKGWEAEKAMVEKMFEKKVYVTEGKGLNAEKPGWFRIIFSQEEAVIREGLKRVFEAVGA